MEKNKQQTTKNVNLTIKEQALELYKQYDELVKDHTRGVTVKPLAKECALIAARKIKQELVDALDDEVSGIHEMYWRKVIQEIEKL